MNSRLGLSPAAKRAPFALLSLLSALVFTHNAASESDDVERLVVLNFGWLEGFAKTYCEGVKHQIQQNQGRVESDWLPFHLACNNLHFTINAFVDELRTEVATHRNCKGLTFVQTDNRRHWNLTISFVPGGNSHQWLLDSYAGSLRRGVKATSFRGEGAAKDIVTSVCAIVLRQGGKVE